jgi:hypothetical protein
LVSGRAGPDVEIIIGDSSPGLFQMEANAVIATRADGSLISPASPAMPGDILILYAAGLGATSPAVTGLTIPAAAHPIVVNLFLLVDAFRRATRPGLTWALLAVLVYVFAVSDPAGRTAMLGEITFGAFTALFWWFGSRYAKK